MRPIATDIPWSVCAWVTTVGCAKTAQPIEMPFGGLFPREGVVLLGGTGIPHCKV